MTADSFDNFEYSRASEHTSEAQRKHYWAVAIGLQAVDGLVTSTYLREVSQSYISGKMTLEDVGILVRAHHAAGKDSHNAEADLVSQRIAELLASGAFFLSPEMLVRVHSYLFQDLDPVVYRPGEFKTERMVKQEEILNGDSVLYADPFAYDLSLNGAFATEMSKAYGAFTDEELASFCHFISFLWQVHPFYEGNTRTIAVFSELYLNQLGFSVANEPFAENARYFRDALVRAMYRNAQAEIYPDTSFLVRFYQNAIGQEAHGLNREDLICTALFENPTLLKNIDPNEALNQRTTGND